MSIRGYRPLRGSQSIQHSRTSGPVVEVPREPHSSRTSASTFATAGKSDAVVGDCGDVVGELIDSRIVGGLHQWVRQFGHDDWVPRATTTSGGVQYGAEADVGHDLRADSGSVRAR